MMCITVLITDITQFMKLYQRLSESYIFLIIIWWCRGQDLHIAVENIDIVHNDINVCLHISNLCMVNSKHDCHAETAL